MSQTRRAARYLATSILKKGTAKIQIAIAVALAVYVAAFLLLMLAMALAKANTASTADISAFGHDDIPPVALLAYQQAVATGCDGLDWPILAGIGKVESNHGRHGGTALLPNGLATPPILGPELNGSGAGGNLTPFPVGQWAGRWGLGTRWQQALGPMQFLPGTFAQYAPTAAATPHNINRAAAAAAALLCDHDPATNIETAILAYNHSTDYVNEVLHWAALYTEHGHIATSTAIALADHPNITLTPAAEQDLHNGIVDPRLINLLHHLAASYQLDILSFKTGHPRCKVLPNQINAGPSCNISNHWEGRAVDITAIAPAGQPPQAVSPRNDAAREITTWLATMPTDNPNRPNEVGSPWNTFNTYHGHFTNGLHQDHLHIGYQQGL